MSTDTDTNTHTNTDTNTDTDTDIDTDTDTDLHIDDNIGANFTGRSFCRDSQHNSIAHLRGRARNFTRTAVYRHTCKFVVI